MTNNDILRRIRYTFDYNDSEMIALFVSGGKEVTRAEVSDWLKKEDDPESKEIDDEHLAAFLNGFINEKRGKKEGEQPAPEIKLNNNIILRKLKIALDLRDEDIINILESVRFRLGKAELSAFFRNPSQSQYRPLKDQILRNFLHGMQVVYHDKEK